MLKTLAILAGLAVGSAGASNYFELRQDLSKSQSVVVGLKGHVAANEKAFADQGDKLERLYKEREALVTTQHVDALRIWGSFPELCSKIPLKDIVGKGDIGCSKAIQAWAAHREFPSVEMSLQIYRDPAKAIVIGRQFLTERCSLIEDPAKRPNVCKDVL